MESNSGHENVSGSTGIHGMDSIPGNSYFVDSTLRMFSIDLIIIQVIIVTTRTRSINVALKTHNFKADTEMLTFPHQSLQVWA